MILLVFLLSHPVSLGIYMRISPLAKLRGVVNGRHNAHTCAYRIWIQEVASQLDIITKKAGGRQLCLSLCLCRTEISQDWHQPTRIETSTSLDIRFKGMRSIYRSVHTCGRQRGSTTLANHGVRTGMMEMTAFETTRSLNRLVDQPRRIRVVCAH